MTAFWGQLALACALLAASSALAAPTAGARVVELSVEDTAGQWHHLPDARAPVLVIYEDQKAGAQNQRARDEVGRITDKPENQGRLILMAVADLEKWNWWPARKYALADLQKIAKKEDTTLYCDWKGLVRRAWGLTKGKSGYVLIAPDGVVRFASEGPLAEPQLRELVARLRELGLAI